MKALGPVDVRLPKACSTLVCGPSYSGKSVICSTLIRNRNTMYQVPISKVVFLYKHWQTEYDNLKEDIPSIIFVSDLDEMETELSEPSDHIMAVFDDFMLEILTSANQYMLNLLSRRSHHLSISVVLVSQLLFPRNLRSLVLNIHNFCLTRNPNKSQIQTFFKQYDTSDWRHLMSCYNHAINSKPFGHLFISNHQNTNPLVSIRNSITVETGTIAYPPPHLIFDKKL